MTRVSITRKINVIDPSAVPAWVPAPGNIAEISLNTAHDVRPLDWTTPFGSQEGVFQSWNGSAFAPELGSLGSMLFHGGGHNNYDGNEVYRYDIASQLWSRVGEPTHIPAGINANTYTDPATYEIKAEYGGGTGVKASLHTYASQFYINPSLAGNTNGYFCTVPHPNTKVVHKYDLDVSGVTGWSRAEEIGPGDGINGYYPTVAWDSTRGRAWMLSNGPWALRYFDWATKTWTKVGASSNTVASGTPFAYSPDRDILVMFHMYQSGQTYLRVCNPASPTEWVNVPFAGTPPQNGSTSALLPMVWCGDLQCFLLYAGGGSKTIFKLIPPSNLYSGTWLFESETLVGATPPWTMNGPLTKFQYIPSIRCAVYADGRYQNVVAFRLQGT